MTEPAHQPPGGHQPTPGQTAHFTPADLQQFKTEDGQAGRYIVGLMLGIFVMGVALYIGVAYWCVST